MGHAWLSSGLLSALPAGTLLRVESALEAPLMGGCCQALGTSAPACLGELARAHQSWPVICYSVVLLGIRAGVAGQCSKPLGKQWPVLISTSCLQADAGTLAPLGIIRVCWPRLVPYPQHTDPAWPDMLLVNVLMQEALQAVAWGTP